MISYILKNPIYCSFCFFDFKEIPKPLEWKMYDSTAIEKLAKVEF